MISRVKAGMHKIAKQQWIGLSQVPGFFVTLLRQFAKSRLVSMFFSNLLRNTVKPVLSGHARGMLSCPLKTGPQHSPILGNENSPMTTQPIDKVEWIMLFA